MTLWMGNTTGKVLTNGQMAPPSLDLSFITGEQYISTVHVHVCTPGLVLVDNTVSMNKIICVHIVLWLTKHPLK